MGILVYFDGDCAVCNGWVSFVLKRDKKHHFRFAPLFGDTFEQEMPEKLKRDIPDSIVVQKPSGKLLIYSDAILYILEGLGGGYKVFSALFSLIPRFIRDFFYRLFARIRKVFQKKGTPACPMPPPEWRPYLLP